MANVNPQDHSIAFTDTMNRYWRITATGFSFFLFAIGTLILSLFLVAFILPLPIAKLSKQKITRKIIQRTCYAYIIIMRFLGILTFAFNTQSHIFKPGRLIIANHPTLLDVIFLFAMVPNASCIVKAERCKNPLMAVSVSLAGYLNNAGAELAQEAADVIRAGETLIVFPEGTRSTKHLNKFKRGAANIAIMADCEISLVHIDCTPITLRKHEKWYAVPAAVPHFQFTVLPAIDRHSCIDVTRPIPIQARHLTDFLYGQYNSRLLTKAA